MSRCWRRRLPAALGVGALWSVAGACAGRSGEPAAPASALLNPVPASVAVYQGQHQVVDRATPVPIPPAVIVRDSMGHPLAHVLVQFIALSGTGMSYADPPTSDTNGIVGVSWWASGGAYGTDTLEVVVNAANVAGNPVYFTATVKPPPPTALTISQGEGQSATVGELVGKLAVRVQNATNAPVPNIEVHFAVTAGGGYVIGDSAATDVTGIALVPGWRLGSAPGDNEVTATVHRDSLPDLSVTFHATGVARVPARIAIWAGDQQTAAVGTPVPISPAVDVIDSTSHVVLGVPVAFHVTGGGGSISDTSVMTDANGVAVLPRWTLGPTAGTNTIAASMTNNGVAGNPLTITAYGAVRSQIPSSIAVHAGQGQTDTVGRTLAVPPSAIVRDANGLGIGGLTVLFVPMGGGSITGAYAPTDTGGVATVGSWTLGAVPGQYCLYASIVALGPQSPLCRFSRA